MMAWLSRLWSLIFGHRAPESAFRPAHRDDLPYEVVEEIEAKFAEMFPGMKVVFAGDQPEESIPEAVRERIAELESKMSRSLATGTCCDCGKKMPGPMPVIGVGAGQRWEAPEGWSMLLTGEKPVAFTCDECDEAVPTIDDDPEAVAMEEHLLSDEHPDFEELSDEALEMIPKEVLEKLAYERWDTALGRHPELGYFVLVKNPGIHFAWKQWEEV